MHLISHLERQHIDVRYQVPLGIAILIVAGET